jgi:MoxR-like ATPase
MDWFEENTIKFEIIFNKFTVPEEVFGPISISSLEHDKYRRITTAMLPEAHIAFLDEVFNASSAILNTTLKIMNERIFQNGDGKFYKVPLQLCAGASNRWPSDEDGGKELAALFDRFLFRKSVRYITSQSGRDKLLWSGVNHHKPLLSTKINIYEIAQAKIIASHFTFSDEARNGFNRIIQLLGEEGIRPGDRRQYKAIAACKAYAYLCGGEGEEDGIGGVQMEHLEILSHILWDDPVEQPQKCARIISRIANPVGSQILDIISQAQDILTKSTPGDAMNKLKDLQDKLNALPANERRGKAQAFIKKELSRLVNTMVGN